MTLRKDGDRRAVELTLELPGSPEEVFRMFATGAGYSAWFVPSQIEERVGGKIAFDLGGGMVAPGTVTRWEPPHRFSYEEANWSGEAPPLVTDIFVDAKAGGTCVVRMVHSLFTERDDWDKEIEGMAVGWPGFFEVLRTYMTHFRGLPAASVRPTASIEGEVDGAWRPLVEGLGFQNARPGDRVAAAAGAPRLEGVVEGRHDREKDRAIRLRLSEPAPGAALVGAYAWGGRAHAAVSLFFYGDGAEAAAAREAPVWDAWLAERLSTSGS